MKQVLVWGAAALGVMCLGLTVMYFITPANALPHFMPGYAADVARTHYKHGIGVFILGLGLFAYAWFKSAPAK